MDNVCLQKTRFHANPALGTEPFKWQANPLVCVVQTPSSVANQPLLCGFWGLTPQNRGFRLQTPYFAQTLSFAGVSEGLGSLYFQGFCRGICCGFFWCHSVFRLEGRRASRSAETKGGGLTRGPGPWHSHRQKFPTATGIPPFRVGQRFGGEGDEGRGIPVARGRGRGIPVAGGGRLWHSRGQGRAILVVLGGQLCLLEQRDPGLAAPLRLC